MLSVSCMIAIRFVFAHSRKLFLNKLSVPVCLRIQTFIIAMQNEINKLFARDVFIVTALDDTIGV